MARRIDNIMSKAKPRFVERMKTLLGSEEYQTYCEFCNTLPQHSVRCNTLKISIDDLKKRLEKKWKIEQPYKDHPEIFIIKSELMPGEIGKAEEYLLGYYYVQEIASMMPLLSLKPTKDDIFLDLAAAPGSKTTQAAAMMENQGTIIANEIATPRIVSLATNIQRIGATNIVVTKEDGRFLCKRLAHEKWKFDKILVDAPCSGEGTIRSSQKTISMFSENMIRNLGGIQKKLVENALKVLKVGGELIYSTCTHAPEENEAVVSYIIKNFPVEIQPIKLPIKTRQGITKWEDKEYHKDVTKCARIYPHDNNTEGFFIAKLKLMEGLK